MAENLNKWNDSLNYVELGRKADISVQSLGTVVLLKDVLSKQIAGVDVHLSECAEAGHVQKGSVAKIVKHLEELGGSLVYRFFGNGYNTYFWFWKDSVVELSVNSDYISVTAQSQNEKFITDLRVFIKPHFRPALQQGYVFAIVRQGNHLGLNNIGNAGIELVRHNYTAEVLEGYDYVIKDLNSVAPSGRISIMEGEPGTGKTHLVRAMLLDVPDGMFVLVSPDMVASLGGPELLPLLLQHRAGITGPIILVLEDADKCLVTRAGDNINSIQSLLNLGDGILGSLLDIRIIATTNAKKLEMEAAIMRPGRLSRRLEVGPLDLETALNIFKVLCPKAKLPKTLAKSKKATAVPQTFTLAEIYSLARKAGWNPTPRKKEVEVDDLEDPRPAVYDDEDED